MCVCVCVMMHNLRVARSVFCGSVSLCAWLSTVRFFLNIFYHRFIISIILFFISLFIYYIIDYLFVWSVFILFDFILLIIITQVSQTRYEVAVYIKMRILSSMTSFI